MKVVLFVLFGTLALAQGERNWEKIFPRHLENPPHLPLPNGIPSPRIVGGDEVVPNSRPFQVALFIEVDGGTAFCGGSLISNKTVLTAAHCVEVIKGPVEVVLGAHNIRDTTESTQISILSSKVIVHPDWDSSNLQNDLALVILPEAVTFNDAIQPVKLASEVGNKFEGQTAIASGWGKDSDSSSSISPTLRKVDVEVISNGICNIAYFGLIHDSHICTSGRDGKSTCNGDSGGPLTVEDTQVGIVSFGIALGCEIGWPAAFTRVSEYINWIEANKE